jgi:hypothetical protein
MDDRRFQKLIAELNRELGVPVEQPSLVHRMVESARGFFESLVDEEFDLDDLFLGPRRQRLRVSRSQ